MASCWSAGQRLRSGHQVASRALQPGARLLVDLALLHQAVHGVGLGGGRLPGRLGVMPLDGSIELIQRSVDLLRLATVESGLTTRGRDGGVHLPARVDGRGEWIGPCRGLADGDGDGVTVGVGVALGLGVAAAERAGLALGPAEPSFPARFGSERCQDQDEAAVTASPMTTLRSPVSSPSSAAIGGSQALMGEDARAGR